MGLLIGYLIVISALAGGVVVIKSGLVGPRGSRSATGLFLVGMTIGSIAGVTVYIAMVNAVDIQFLILTTVLSALLMGMMVRWTWQKI